MENKSGRKPVGQRLLVLMPEKETVSEGGIILTEQVQDNGVTMESRGILVAYGSAAWVDIGDGRPWAAIGDTVIFVTYAGFKFEGPDGKTYRLMNDEDLIGIEHV